jgi:tRNA(fMet)-specific endonuclease VapC
MNEVLVDTDTLSLFLRNQPQVMDSAGRYLSYHPGFTFSVITHFEILRGLKIKDARVQMDKFKGIRERSTEVNLSPAIVHTASEIYSNLYKAGTIIGDADILIAATAMELGLELVTNNTAHFARISGLEVRNWNT